MKQTAVEWLYERLERMIPRTVLYNIDKKEYFEQAKEMEKQEIIDAHLTGLIYPLEMEASKQAEQYYNEKFKKQ